MNTEVQPSITDQATDLSVVARVRSRVSSVRIELNWREFGSRAGFAFTILTVASLSKSKEGLAWQVICTYGLASIIGLAALVTLFEHACRRRLWESLVVEAKGLDTAYVEFGLGLLLAASSLSGNAWLLISMLLAGTTFAGAGVAELEVRGYLKLLFKSPKVALVVSLAFIVVGAVYTITQWKALNGEPWKHLPDLLVFFGLGVIFLRAYYRRRRQTLIGRLFHWDEAEGVISEE